jgi:hypothetical protein
VEDQEKIQPEEDEVESHKHGKNHPHAAENAEPQDGEEESDFELHSRKGGGRSNPN